MSTEKSVSEWKSSIENMRDEIDEFVKPQLLMTQKYRRGLALKVACGDESARDEIAEVKQAITELEARQETLQEAIEVASGKLLEAQAADELAKEHERLATLMDILAQRHKVAGAIDESLGDMAVSLETWFDLAAKARTLGGETAHFTNAKDQLASAIWYHLMQRPTLSDKGTLLFLLNVFGGMGRPSPTKWRPLSANEEITPRSIITRNPQHATENAL